MCVCVYVGRCYRRHAGPPVKSYPSKTDYHPLAACFEVLRVIESSGSLM